MFFSMCFSDPFTDVSRESDAGSGDKGQGVRLCQRQDNRPQGSKSWPISKRLLYQNKCHEILAKLFQEKSGLCCVNYLFCMS